MTYLDIQTSSWLARIYKRNIAEITGWKISKYFSCEFNGKFRERWFNQSIRWFSCGLGCHWSKRLTHSELFTRSILLKEKQQHFSWIWVLSHAQTGFFFLKVNIKQTRDFVQVFFSFLSIGNGWKMHQILKIVSIQTKANKWDILGYTKCHFFKSI